GRSGRRFMELKLRRTNFQHVAVSKTCFVDFLAVDERAIAAASIADPPGVVFVEDDRVHPRSERVRENDIAVQTATDTIMFSRVERELSSLRGPTVMTR